ncbi:glutamine amidotransferase [Halovivax asiaticus JCM 14624]|uniref:anthranilate synthase n=1 Tax=Halovivax asiaticus JCM 14624 TaxID=1227490 RepID=M0BF02_9EURY|nr:aminodeoxychorismate/anthranilate synthase component II [Halovivax asiaticus]ELZ08883.1 glutamine amidotransferase [Halovivax asiaticus JCM 14624]
MTDDDGGGSSEGPTILLIDNYDSFVYNLVQYVGRVAGSVLVRRNDVLDVDDVRRLDPDGIVISPGPGTPADAGISIPLFAETGYPILGVCLGHQALCAAHGADVGQAPDVVHGKPSVVTHDGEGIFAGLPERVQVGRYHSLAVPRTEIPDSLVETAQTVDDREVVMAVRHRQRPHVGVQFHPESILTRTIEGSSSARRDESSTGEPGDTATEPERTTGISLAIGRRLVENFCELAARERRRADS